MILDRALQNKILVESAEHYPSPLYLERGHELLNVEEKKLAANLKYLEQHYLICANSVTVSLDGFFSINGIQITRRGLDFLQGDEGLSAILNVVTVRFEADTLSAILTTKINQSDLPEDEKNKLVEAVKELPAEGMKHLMTRVLDKGIDNIPNLIPYLIQTLSNLPT